MEKIKKYKLAVLVSHPIQYHVPIFKKLSQHPQVDLTVYFCCDYGIRERNDPGFGIIFKWDIPLLDGYKYKFLKNYSPNPFPSFFGQINPSIIREILVNKYSAILIFSYRSVTFWFALFTSWVFRIPTIFKGEGDLLTPVPFLKRISKKALFIPLFKLFSFFLYSCKANLDYYKYYKVPENKLFFVPCAVDNVFWKGKAGELMHRRSQLKKASNINDNSPVILFTGKLISGKRPMDLLKAYELTYKELNSYLLFVGDGPQRKNLEDYARDKRLDKVCFAGFKNQTELPAFYVIADIFVLPSQWDLSPKTMNEVMNFSLPVITTDRVGTAFDLIKTGENGFIYPVGNIQALADDLRKVLGNPITAKKMGAKSLEIISSWDIQKDVNGIVGVLEFSERR